MAYNTTPFHGKTARVEKNDVIVSFTLGWTISSTLDMADISSQGDSWKTGIPGMGQWSGSFNGSLAMGNTEHAAIINNIITATPGTQLTDMKFLLDAATNALTGNIYVTGVTFDMNIGDKGGFTVNFAGDGALSITDAA